MELDIQKLDYEGRGISFVDGKICFVKGALPSERVKASLQKNEKRFMTFKVDEVVTPSLNRKKSFCPFSSLCGGCTYDIVSYEDSLFYKKQMIEEIFERNHILIPDFEIVESIPNLGVRNKVSLKVQDANYGFYKEESHEFVAIENCFLVSKPIQALLNDFSLLGIKNGSLTIRSNYNDELLIIIESFESPKIEKELIDNHKIAGIIYNEQVVYNNSYFIEKRETLLYKIHYNAFFQINPYISEQISKDVLPFFQKEDEVFDLYCGVGYFSLKLARRVKSVIGIEVNLNGVIDAKYNADLNHMDNLSFHVGEVEKLIDKIPNNVNKVLVDPPRSGLHKNVIECLLKNKFESICYISCNPKTLVRDLSSLNEMYEITFFRAYDMFPFTKHIECVFLLKRR